MYIHNSRLPSESDRRLMAGNGQRMPDVSTMSSRWTRPLMRYTCRHRNTHTSQNVHTKSIELLCQHEFHGMRVRRHYMTLPSRATSHAIARCAELPARNSFNDILNGAQCISDLPGEYFSVPELIHVSKTNKSKLKTTLTLLGIKPSMKKIKNTTNYLYSSSFFSSVM